MRELAGILKNCGNIHAGIVELLQAARSDAARNVNAIMTAAHWDIGRRQRGSCWVLSLWS